MKKILTSDEHDLEIRYRKLMLEAGMSNIEIDVLLRSLDFWAGVGIARKAMMEISIALKK